MNEYIQGFLLQMSLILALGAQNIFVLEMGLRHKYQYMVAAICSVCDIFLVLIGALGVSNLISSVVELKIVVGTTGVLFLVYYGLLKIKEFLFFSKVKKKKISNTLSRKKVALMALSFTLLNPHVYIDTFFLIGGYAGKFDSQHKKILFGLGAGSFSCLWFFFLAGFASKFSIFLTKERVAKWVSLFTGLTLAYLAYKLGLDSYHEILIYLSMS
ncbi:LysE/ArgO family amino acid transporter [Halobacteriovorax sp.]|uniref:LysE/ArgO family amino acid transporter n=1 Tax=Halobacteriovorax sp. TaxID=2020862 RepID=UPI00356171F7